MCKENINMGIISLSENLAESYSEELGKHDMDVKVLTKDNVAQYIDQLDALIIGASPDQDVGYTCQLLMEMKENSSAFVWVLSPQAPQSMRIVYLKLGAMGVLSDECNATEVQLLISNAVGKNKIDDVVTNASEKYLEDIGQKTAIELVPKNLSVRIDGSEEIPLTRLEFKTIELLYRNRNVTVSYEELYDSIWKMGFDNKNYRIANLIFHLRKKMEKDIANPVFIKTIRSKGYMLVC